MVTVYSSSAGSCHIELTFATGFTYSADVTFTSQTEGLCPGCAPYIGPTSGPFTVNNPSDMRARTLVSERARAQC